MFHMILSLLHDIDNSHLLHCLWSDQTILGLAGCCSLTSNLRIRSHKTKLKAHYHDVLMLGSWLDLGIRNLHKLPCLNAMAPFHAPQLSNKEISSPYAPLHSVKQRCAAPCISKVEFGPVHGSRSSRRLASLRCSRGTSLHSQSNALGQSTIMHTDLQAVDPASKQQRLPVEFSVQQLQQQQLKLDTASIRDLIASRAELRDILGESKNFLKIQELLDGVINLVYAGRPTVCSTGLQLRCAVCSV